MLNKPFSEDSYLESMRKLARFFENGKITFDEFASNTLGYLVFCEDPTRRQFLSELPNDLVGDVTTYMKHEREPSAFVPRPRPHSAEERQAEMQEFESLYNATLEALESARGK